MALWMVWLAAGLVALGAELFTGSLFLLALAVGMGGAALAAALGAEPWVQIIAVSLVAIAGWVCIWKYRKPHMRAPVQPILDEGGPVEILSWSDAARCTVRYRGAVWQALLVGPHSEKNRYVVSRIDGVELQVIAEP